MVPLSVSTSPLASTVIFFVKSPLATAVVTSEMFRTCAVRLSAIPFTLLVNSSQVPETPSTLACPPNIPSVPTSLATRDTSEEKVEIWPTIVLIVVARFKKPPLISKPSILSRIFVFNFPIATLLITVATSSIGEDRDSRIKLILLTTSNHLPLTSSVSTLASILPFSAIAS